ncbi:hypothetical protein [Paenibacillus lentus]|uniref:Uncharacterized protein n=1 Tax=Paenibacillus lentus TaxID=1338368 RepID=A0A3Q8S6U1_9BACL|nr:hypothetical protein [Paenibacillus lentus]AZK48812.1 hypothetical protein EIM92_00780 [Paenibacillus lentus]
MECIVHFEVQYKQETKELRGLIFLDEGEKPTEKDFLLMFEGMGYKLRLTDPENLVFTPIVPSSEYQRIRIRRLDTGEESYQEDRELKSLISNLLPKDSRPI